MNKKIQTAGDWLTGLSGVLAEVQCRREGKTCESAEAFDVVSQLFSAAKKNNTAVWWVGNGGSAAVCSHLAQDLLNKLSIRSQALSDVSLLTCMANDNGYDEIYAKPLGVLAVPGDLLIAISSSGKSPNILKAARVAEQKKMKLITLSAFAPDNPLWNVKAQVSFYLPSTLYGHVELGHAALLHAVIETLWLANTKK